MRLTGHVSGSKVNVPLVPALHRYLCVSHCNDTKNALVVFLGNLSTCSFVDLRLDPMANTWFILTDLEESEQRGGGNEDKRVNKGEGVRERVATTGLFM